MDLAERKQAARDVLAAYASSDATALRRLLRDDVQWWVPPSAAARYQRPLRGIEAVLGVLAGPSLMYQKPTIRWTVHNVAASDDDTVMLNATMTATLLSGRAYTNEYCFVFRFAGDQVTEGTEYADTAFAIEQAGGAAPTRPGPRPRPPVPSTVSPQAQERLGTESAFGGDTEPADLADADGWRRYVARRDEILGQMFASQMPADLPLDRREREINGVRTYVLRAFDVDERGDTPIFVDIHGGALILGGGELAALMTAGRALRTGMIHWAIDYRMPPDHPYPAALDDCIAVYRQALAERDPRDIVVGGGSAGGNLAAALLVRAKDEGLPMPAALVLLTPEVDLTESGDSFVANLGIDHVLSPLMHVNRLYANGHDLAHPYLSPLFADLTGFPPTFLQAGTRDLFLSNTVRMHRRLRDAGVEAELHIWEAMPHGGFGGAPEDVEVMVETRRFLDAHRR